jgi:hypothetical protein
VTSRTQNAGSVADKKPKPVTTKPADGGGGGQDKKSPFVDPAMKKHYSHDPNKSKPRT